jgi:hypothetical protein
LYDAEKEKVLKWSNPETGYSLLSAYKATLEYCKVQPDPKHAMSVLEIYEIVNEASTQSFSIEGAYAALKDAEVKQDIIEEEEDVPDQLIPSSNMGPWIVDMQGVTDEHVDILDHDKSLVARAMVNEKTMDSLEQNVRLISKAPELMLLALRMMGSIHDKEEGIRTAAEQQFLEGMYILFGGHEIRVEVDILDQNSRDLLLTFVEESKLLYTELYTWIQHGKSPTEEMKTDMYNQLETTIAAQNSVQTHLL